MPTTYIAAKDELFGIVKAVFDDAKWVALLGYVIDVRWPEVARASKPDFTKQWARVSAQSVSDGQATLSNVQNTKVFEAVGLLYVQLFCPRNMPASQENGLLIASDLQAAFRKQSPTGELWFRNQKISELPPTEDSYPINVQTDFQYRTLQPA